MWVNNNASYMLSYGVYYISPNFYHTSTDWGRVYIDNNANVNKIVFQLGSAYSSIVCTFYVTIEYTKTS